MIDTDYDALGREADRRATTLASGLVQLCGSLRIARILAIGTISALLGLAATSCGRGTEGEDRAGASDLEQSLESLDREIESRPDDADLHFKRSNILRRMGRSEEAEAAYERYIELLPYGDFPGDLPGRLGYQ